MTGVHSDLLEAPLHADQNRSSAATIGKDINFQKGAFESAPHTLFNARIGWNSPEERWQVAAFGKNLSDERYRTVGFEAADFGGWTQVGYGEPRWWGVTVEYRL